MHQFWWWHRAVRETMNGLSANAVVSARFCMQQLRPRMWPPWKPFCRRSRSWWMHRTRSAVCHCTGHAGTNFDCNFCCWEKIEWHADAEVRKSSGCCSMRNIPARSWDFRNCHRIGNGMPRCRARFSATCSHAIWMPSTRSSEHRLFLWLIASFTQIV